MKYLSSYTEKPISKLIKEQGGFFAFNNKQFEESRQEGIEYVRLYAGFIAPKENAKAIYDGIEKITKDGIKQDMKDHTIKQIIFRECSNYELQYQHDGFSEIVEKLADYPISKEDIGKYYNKFIQHCIENDLY